MPGIVGFSSPLASDGNAARVLSGMQQSITHFSTYRRSEIFSDGRVCAAHSDKEIIQRGPQPFEDRGIFVWFDGELFKTDRLKLGQGDASGCRPTEILCRLFHDDPSFSFLERIDGIFSCAVYDSQRGRVHLATDRYGLRYLYWTIHQSSLVWASELKAMLALPGFHPAIDRAGVDEFMIDGYLWGNRSWFEGVQLLAPGTVLTWDIRKSALEEKRYWSWDRIRPIRGLVDETEIADELARLFVEAVKARCRPEERVGVLLSGGLDSRAVMAATPERAVRVKAVTFGKENCADCIIAARAAGVKGAEFHLLELNGHSFMDGRVAGVWWNDGQPNMLDMHVSCLISQGRTLFDIVLDGFLGDVFCGGSYLRPFGKDELWKIDNRGRRFIVNGPRFYGTWLDYRLPFMDNDLVELLMSLPKEMRAKHHLYRIMLLRTFPEFYEQIPWLDTSVPIKFPRLKSHSPLFKYRWMVTWFRGAIRRRLMKSELQASNYTDYPAWIRVEPARSFFQSLLKNPEALYPEFVSRDKILRAWEKHLEGADHSKMLFLHVTFEIWLQQVFQHRYRPSIDEPGLQAG